MWIHIDDGSALKMPFYNGDPNSQTTEELCAQTTALKRVLLLLALQVKTLSLFTGLINSRNHSGGTGIGAVLGAKN